MVVWYVFFALGWLLQVNGQAVSFNFEISLHVKDEIAQLLEIGMRPVRVLNQAFTETRLLNPHDFNGTRSLYWHLYKIFPEAQALYCSFEDGRQIAYVGNNVTYPTIYIENGANCTNCRYGYDIDKAGNPTDLVVIQDYDARTRLWYIEAKKAYVRNNISEMWSEPIFFVVNKAPGVIFTMPVVASNNEFDGLISLNYDFRDISKFLTTRYPDETRTVFIADHPTGYLLGCSEPTPLSVLNESTGVSNMIFANRSSSSLISTAMRKLETNPSPEALVIVDGYYIQSTLYSDRSRNIQWRIVVIMPAKLRKDFVEWTDPTGIGVICLTIFALAITLSFLFLVCKHRHARIVKMSQVSFVTLFLFGCLLLNVSILFSLGENTSAMCALRAWISPIMISLTIAPLLFKTWWIYVLFSRPFSPRPPTKSVFAKMPPVDRMKVLALSMTARTLLLVLVEFFILLIGNLIAPPNPVETTTVGTDGFYSSHTLCGAPNRYIVWINNLFFAGLLATACILAFKARNINENLAESRSVGVAIYGVSLFALIVQIVRGSQDLVIEADTILSAVGIAWGTSVSALLVLGPRFLKLFTIGDDAACEWLQAGRQKLSSNLSSTTSNPTDTAQPSRISLMPRPAGSTSSLTTGGVL